MEEFLKYIDDTISKKEATGKINYIIITSYLNEKKYNKDDYILIDSKFKNKCDINLIKDSVISLRLNGDMYNVVFVDNEDKEYIKIYKEISL